MCWLVFCQSPCGIPDFFQRRMLPRTFFDLIPHPGGQFPENAEEVLSQVIWIRVLRCLWGWGGSGSMGTRPVQKAGQTVKLIRRAVGHFWEAELTLRRGRMGVSVEVINRFSWFATQRAARLQCLHWFVTNFLYASVPLQLKQTDWDESAPAWLTLRFYCSFQTSLIFLLLRVKIWRKSREAGIILNYTM